jgi:hypothetical protein
MTPWNSSSCNTKSQQKCNHVLSLQPFLSECMSAPQSSCFYWQRPCTLVFHLAASKRPESSCITEQSEESGAFRSVPSPVSISDTTNASPTALWQLDILQRFCPPPTVCSTFSWDHLLSIAACILNGQSQRCYSQYENIVCSVEMKV